MAKPFFNYGSYYTYSPKGTSEIEKESQKLAYKIKNNKTIDNSTQTISVYIAETLKKELPNLEFKDFFGKETYLIPAPRSSLIREEGIWPPDEIVKALSQKGLGIRWPCLVRAEAVQRSSHSKPNERAQVKDHLRTIKLNLSGLLNRTPQKIIIVDDIITTGATLFSCAKIVKEKFPLAEVYCFAVMVAITKPENFRTCVRPHKGRICYFEDTKQTHRYPEIP